MGYSSQARYSSACETKVAPRSLKSSVAEPVAPIDTAVTPATGARLTACSHRLKF